MMEATVLRVLIIDDHAVVRDGLMKTLHRAEEEIRCVGAQDAGEALQLLQDEEYDLVLLDLMLPGINGMSFLGVLRKRFPSLPVVILSALDDADTIERAMRQGASGFVPKYSSSKDLLDALHQVLSGVVFLPLALRDAHRGSRSLSERYGITAGQMRVLELLGLSKTNREIADLLGLVEGTVKIHVSAIFKALKVTNRGQALMILNKRKPARRVT